ncbi:hypothetical protein [Amnibacterium kyonggiense]|uniref:Uncharacterized protein n=1 Tax=Amnibacterium kyonggiense TaxID=595671 RepID=A0A4V3EAB4_9MICO|nr:hypothetical protein [Amnibacterium kyonggiense]TDS75748.1 hypothetical protein CLV52_2855 [Amnibacterium kyonggiense]
MDHIRDDGELLGRIERHGDGWVALDRLGRRVTGTTDLAEAEAALEELGLGYLAERWELETEDGSVQPVRIVEVGPERVRVKLEDFGAIDGPRRLWDLPNPAPPTLRQR